MLIESQAYVEVDGGKFVDDGSGNPKLDDAGNPVPFVEEQTVPYSRFKEVNDKLKATNDRIAELEQGKQDGTLTVDQQKELAAKKYLQGMLEETLQKREEDKKNKEAQELKEFNEQVGEVLLVNTDVKKADFLKFLEQEGDDYVSVASAMKGYKRLQETKKQTEDKTKQNLSTRPKLPAHEGSGSGSYDASKDRGKSLHQIADEAIHELANK